MSILITILLVIAVVGLIIVFGLLIAVLLYILSIIFTLKSILEKMEKNIGFVSKTALKTFTGIKNSKSINFLLHRKKKSKNKEQ